MARRAGLLLLCLVPVASAAGCAAVAEAIVEMIFDSALSVAVKEDKDERNDRYEMERYRERYTRNSTWPNDPGVEVKAREAFRREHGRDPNLNWHDRKITVGSSRAD